MAKVQAVWGIDIGQCSLKALRCVPGENGEVVADAFDFVEYPKILSQPDVEPEELIKEALEQFLSRNDVKGDKVAISVTGQAGLSRFFKPPPVDAKTLPDIVKYEAKQQIPFPLEDVIWDYQKIGGNEVDGLIVDAEVGLFAMKREAVYRALQPFTDSGIEVDYIQLSPLSAFNFVVRDILGDVSEDDEIDPENPPESMVLLALGTETTDLVVTNGINLWMRNIPIGGNHFTKQLSRELKLTFTKAEHLKRNTRLAEDPKTLFQAMRPVFNDLVTEIQRSLSYFRGINKNATIGRMVMVGNAAKLPGLRQFLIKSLETEIVKFDKFPTLEGDVVINQKTFTENILSFNVAYGLCLQGLSESRIETNLLPQEFLVERLVRAKKPWALASLGALMVGLTCSLLFSANGYWKVHPERVIDGKTWGQADKEVKRVSGISDKWIKLDEEQTKQHGLYKALNRELAQTRDAFRLAPEVYSAIYQAFPAYEKMGELFNPLNEDYSDREVILVDSFEWVQYDKMDAWVKLVDDKPKSLGDHTKTVRELKPFPDPNATDEESADGEDDEVVANNNAKKKNNAQKKNAKSAKSGPKMGADLKGPGRVLVLNCFHDHNDPEKYKDAKDRGREYVRNTLIRNLLFGKVKFEGEETDFASLGLKYPTIVPRAPDIPQLVEIPNPYYAKFLADGSIPETDPSTWSAEEKRKYSPKWEVLRYRFRLEIAWMPTTFEDREKARVEAAKKKAAEDKKKANAKGGMGNAGKNQGLGKNASGKKGGQGQPKQPDPKQPSDPAKKGPVKNDPGKKQSGKNPSVKNDPAKGAPTGPAGNDGAKKGAGKSAPPKQN